MTSRQRLRLAHVVIGSLLAISIAHAAVRHVFDLSRIQGVAALVLVAATAALALAAPSLRRRSHRTAVVATGVACVVALQAIAPQGSFSLLLYVAAAGVGAVTPRRRVWRSVTGSIVAVAVLALLARPVHSLSDVLTIAFSLAVSVGLTNTLVDLRRSRDERERLYDELSRAHEKLRRYALQAEELAELRERSRLARELHDTLGHALTTLTVQLEAIERAVRSRPAILPPLLEDARGLSRRAMTDLRESLTDLRGAPGDRPLAERLRATAEAAAARGGWKLDLDLNAVELPHEVQHALLRVAREALVNVERHASARHVTLALRPTTRGIELAVTDDGAGFDPGGVDAGHFGLRGMRERAALLDGSLEVRSAPGGGTDLHLTVPHGARLREAPAT